MIDIRLLLDDFDATARRLGRKGVDTPLLVAARDLAQRRREQVRQVDSARADMKSGSGEVGTLMREGRREQADALRARMAEARRALDALEEALRRTEAEPR